MKIKILLKIAVLFAVILLSSCTKDYNDTDDNFTTTEIAANAKIDQISNDISDVIDDQYVAQNPTGKTNNSVENRLLPPCVIVTTTLTPTTWTKIINFGTTGCAIMPNGAILRGIITISGSLNYSQQNYVITYSFINFYHNDALIQGNRTVTRSFQSTNYQAAIHPVNVMDMNMTITIQGNVYSRVGTRTRECVEGFLTRTNWDDNVYVVTGSWTTTFPNGANHANAISATQPLRIRMNCNYRIVSGIVTVTRPNHTAVLDYGSGTCDNIATISIDGGVAIPFTFGN